MSGGLKLLCILMHSMLFSHLSDKFRVVNADYPSERLDFLRYAGSANLGREKIMFRIHKNNSEGLRCAKAR